jgi:hypothetical protein
MEKVTVSIRNSAAVNNNDDDCLTRLYDAYASLGYKDSEALIYWRELLLEDDGDVFVELLVPPRY